MAADAAQDDNDEKRGRRRRREDAEEKSEEAENDGEKCEREKCECASRVQSQNQLRQSALETPETNAGSSNGESSFTVDPMTYIDYEWRFVHFTSRLIFSNPFCANSASFYFYFTSESDYDNSRSFSFSLSLPSAQ